MSGEDKFDFSYTAPTEAERREIESIKRQYAPQTKEADKLEILRALNKKVTRLPAVLGWALGVAGTLIMGVGMTMVLEWEMMLWGVVAGVLGVAVAAVAYPVRSALLRRNKQKYGARILQLSDELLGSEQTGQREE